MNAKKYLPIYQALFAALLFGISVPFSKQLLNNIEPLYLASLLYIGAGTGMLAIDKGKKLFKIKHSEARLTKKEIPYIVLMVLLDIAAPILLLFGLTKTTAANTALLNNFEIVTTTVVALVIFKEAIGRLMWVSIGLITLSSIILSIQNYSSLSFSLGSILIILACVCWGFENNFTRKISVKDPIQIVIIKGIGSGTCSLVFALIAKETFPQLWFVINALLLGFVSYGLSIFFYVNAQRNLGAARTSAYYSIAPFMGIAISIVIFKEPITSTFVVATAIMALGIYLLVKERHIHEHTHTFFEHEHRHSHNDGHHNHFHNTDLNEYHSHMHNHDVIIHQHDHTPDLHHRHKHNKI